MKHDLTQNYKMHLVLTVLLTAMTFAVYYKILGHSLLMNWDDYDYVINNEMIRGISWEHLKRAFTKAYFFNYSPLHMVSYMVDYAVFGGIKPAGFFFVNILLHAINGIVLYFLVYRLSGKKFISFTASFIFLLHPVQVESVAWLSQRKNVLSMLFFLTAFYGYTSYRRAGTAHGFPFYVASLTAFTLALLAKSAAVTLPLVLVLYDVCYVPKSNRKGWLINKIPYLLASALISVVTVQSQASLVEAGRATFHSSSPLETVYTMMTVLVRYLGMLFWPVNLSAMYMPPVKFRMDPAVASATALLVLLVIAGCLLYRRDRPLFFWYTLFFIGLIPVSHIIPLPTLMNDRYLYYPLVGASVFIAALLHPLFASTNKNYKMIAALPLCLALLSLPLLSWQRAAVWRNDTSLWADVTRKEPRMPLAWASLGMSYYDAGQIDKALQSYLQALAIDPNYQLALNNIGGLYNEIGEREKARPYLIRVVQLFPDDVKGYLNLGNNYYFSGDLKNAEPLFLKALELEPGLPNAHFALGNIYLGMKKLDVARENYEKAAAVVGNNPEIEYKLACLEALSGKPEEAIRHLQASLGMGFKNINLIRTDPALDSIRGYPEFNLLLQKFQ
jgi:Flp pilus assembly protein TadD